MTVVQRLSSGVLQKKSIIDALSLSYTVAFDEVKFKEGIVYDKHECRIVGFVDATKIPLTYNGMVLHGHLNEQAYLYMNLGYIQGEIRNWL